MAVAYSNLIFIITVSHYDALTGNVRRFTERKLIPYFLPFPVGISQAVCICLYALCVCACVCLCNYARSGVSTFVNIDPRKHVGTEKKKKKKKGKRNVCSRSHFLRVRISLSCSADVDIPAHALPIPTQKS